MKPHSAAGANFVRALRFRALTALYDPVVAWTTRDAELKARLIAQAGIQPGARVLDLGCGTGSLLAALKRFDPDVDAVGLDADPEILRRASTAVNTPETSEVAFVQGFANRLPFSSDSFDRVLSSLFFHHLHPEGKRAALAEVHRVLAPGGELHIADFGRAEVLWRRLAFLGVRILDGAANTRDHAAGCFPDFLHQAGFLDPRRHGTVGVAVGAIDFLSARKSPIGNSPALRGGRFPC